MSWVSDLAHCSLHSPDCAGNIVQYDWPSVSRQCLTSRISFITVNLSSDKRCSIDIISKRNIIKSQERRYINAAFVVSLIFIGTLLQLFQDNGGIQMVNHTAQYYLHSLACANCSVPNLKLMIFYITCTRNYIIHI